MMNEFEIGIAIFSALICVVTRSFLSVADRHIVKQEDNDFFKSVILNSLFPFIIALSVMLCFGNGANECWQLLIQPGVIFSAFGAQAASYVFLLAFRKMPVKSVVVAVKMADLLIPLLIFALTSKFDPSEYLFSFLSVLIFYPLFMTLIRGKTDLHPTLSLQLLGVLLLQSGINSYFAMHQFADTWSRFLAMMTCIFFWRSAFISGAYFFQQVQTKSKIVAPSSSTSVVPYKMLFLRSILAFVVQASFFYSITRVSGSLAWPILNATPLATCFTAHFFLKENVGKAEFWVLAWFILLALGYIFLMAPL